MFVDARSIPPGETIDTDLCVVGTGPAGLTIARELATRDCRVALVESGGLGFDAATQALADGDSTGEAFDSLGETRRRQFGGSANLWDSQLPNHTLGAHLRPLDPLDFLTRDWYPYSGWPFPKSPLQPYYERAEQVFGIELTSPESPAEPCSNGHIGLPFAGNRLQTIDRQLGSLAGFMRAHRAVAERASKIVTYLFANVVGLEADDAVTAVTGLRIATLSGTSFCIRARVFVLAAGGIENARLLLLSDRQRPMGLGNEHDLVGRFFMEHPHIDGGVVETGRRIGSRHLGCFDVHDECGRASEGAIAFRPEVLEAEQLLNIYTLVWPSLSPRANLAYQSVHRVASRLRGRGAPALYEEWRTMLADVLAAARGMDYLAPAAYERLRFGRGMVPGIVTPGWSRAIWAGRRFRGFTLHHMIEQAPNPDSRVLLGSRRDALGRRVAELRYRWSDLDLQSARRAARILQQEFAAAGIGRLHSWLLDQECAVYPRSGAHHHMGTTRMHVDPRYGVVDEHCRVHGLANLFIAGSSVFPTAGAANPTLTIVALAIRLAEHLERVLAPEPMAVGR